MVIIEPPWERKDYAVGERVSVFGLRQWRTYACTRAHTTRPTETWSAKHWEPVAPRMAILESKQCMRVMPYRQCSHNQSSTNEPDVKRVKRAQRRTQCPNQAITRDHKCAAHAGAASSMYKLGSQLNDKMVFVCAASDAHHEDPDTKLALCSQCAKRAGASYPHTVHYDGGLIRDFTQFANEGYSSVFVRGWSGSRSKQNKQGEGGLAAAFSMQTLLLSTSRSLYMTTPSLRAFTNLFWLDRCGNDFAHKGANASLGKQLFQFHHAPGIHSLESRCSTLYVKAAVPHNWELLGYYEKAIKYGVKDTIASDADDNGALPLAADGAGVAAFLNTSVAKHDSARAQSDQPTLFVVPDAIARATITSSNSIGCMFNLKDRYSHSTTAHFNAAALAWCRSFAKKIGPNAHPRVSAMCTTDNVRRIIESLKAEILAKDGTGFVPFGGHPYIAVPNSRKNKSVLHRLNVPHSYRFVRVIVGENDAAHVVGDDLHNVNLPSHRVYVIVIHVAFPHVHNLCILYTKATLDDLQKLPVITLDQYTPPSLTVFFPLV